MKLGPAKDWVEGGADLRGTVITEEGYLFLKVLAARGVVLTDQQTLLLAKKSVEVRPDRPETRLLK